MNGGDDAERDLKELRAREEEELASILSEKYGIGYIDLSRVSINTEALRLVPEDKARTAEVAAFDLVGKKVKLAVRSPQQPNLPPVIEELEDHHYEVEQYMASRASLERAWERYADLSLAVTTKEGVFDISSEELEGVMAGFKKIGDIVKAIEEVSHLKKTYRISRILEVVLGGALAVGASDVHIEPEEESVRLRYRLDGVLSDAARFDMETHGLLLSRLKLLSGLLLNIHDRAQDGRFSIELKGTEIEVRTSVIPGAYGESVVLRVLDPKSLGVPFEELGLEPQLQKLITEEIVKPNGMLLTTGPTGSGKTTMLYACLKKVHRPDIKVVTIEDPIEYHLPGIVQTQVEKDYSFIKALRSILRQDPDVILIGEIRDEEVAKTAIDAALTGHFVFSTLHTNNAAGAFPRLIDLGVDAKTLGSAVSVVMAQRLVRKLCPACRKEIPLEGEKKEKMEKVLAGFRNEDMVPKNRTVTFVPGKCDACNETGYKGRVGVYEAIFVDKEIDDLVRTNPSERDIMAVQKKRNLLTMGEDGVVKVLTGVTSLEELERVVLLDE